VTSVRAAWLHDDQGEHGDAPGAPEQVAQGAWRRPDGDDGIIRMRAAEVRFEYDERGRREDADADEPQEP
jgi:hypothetical protein